MNHTWRHKSTHQQICSRCGQVRRWNGTRWLYRKQGQLVRQRPTCGEKRTDSERYADLRALVEAWAGALTDLVVRVRAGAGGYSPSDFPLVALDQAVVEEIEAAVVRAKKRR